MLEIVLAGVGHTNAHVVRQWGIVPIPNARLTCISAFPAATYSGMLPGVLAGLYLPDQMRIDLSRLCESVGARLVIGEITHFDVAKQRLHLRDGAEVSYNVLSIGVGSQARVPDEIIGAESLVPIKPMQTFVERLDARLAVVRRDRPPGEPGNSPIRVMIVGAGAGGAEIAFGIGPHVRCVLGDWPFEVRLVGMAALAAAGTSPRASRLLAEELERRGVEVSRGCRVSSLGKGVAGLDDGRELPADVVIWAADAVASPILRTTKLPTDERGFLLTRNTLLSVARDDIFVVGDAGTIVAERLPKAGVYAVREGPILWENLRRVAAGRSLIDYRPQRNFLKLISLGDGRAIGEYRGWAFRGAWVWRWKDRIDRRFMGLYQR